MAEIIQFPQRDLSWEGIEEWIIKTYVDAGLTEQMAIDIVERYKPFHDDLFDIKHSRVELPGEVALSAQQLEIIIPVMRNVLISQQVRDAQVIIGLLARERLNEG